MRRLSWAPFIYILFESGIIFLTAKLEPDILDYNNILSILFGTIIVITNISFVLVHCKDPGFVPIPQDSHPLPDQSSRQDDKNKQQLDIISMRKRSTFNHSSSSREKEQLDSDPSKNKHTDQNQNATVAIHIQDPQSINEQQDQVKEENRTPTKSMKEVEMECEPSIQTDHEHDIEIKSIPGSKQNSAEKDIHHFEYLSPKDKQQEEDDQVIKIENPIQTTQESKDKGMYQFEMSIKQRSSSKNEITTIDGSTKSTTKTNEHITTNNFNNIMTQNNAIHCIFTNENNANNYNNNNVVYSSKISDFNQGNKLDDSKLNYSVLDYPQTAIDVNAKILNYSDARNSYNSKLYSFNKRNEHSIPIPLTSPLNDDGNEIRLEINLNDQINFFNGRRQSKTHKQSADINIMSEIHDPNGEAQIVEIRHCLECNIEQKIRSKHCKYCKRCVATYDHHCPWIGNCVGEKNRCNFWWFLLLQFSEVVFALVLVINSILTNSQINITMFVIDILLLGFFLVMVGSLLIYHTYLATENLTTWENARWEKISYLKEWPEQLGSPFNRGMWQNIKEYCQCFKGSKFLVSWYIPKLKNQVDVNQQQNIIIHQQP